MVDVADWTLRDGPLQTSVIPRAPAESRIACCRFALRAIDALSLPDMAGVPLAKSAGQRFRALFCIQPETACEVCLLHSCCLYTRFYESVRAGVSNERYSPPPFVFRALGPRRVRPGDLYVFDLLLFGHAIEGLPAWIIAVNEAGRVGLQTPRYADESAQRFSVESVEECFPDGTAIRRYHGRNQAMNSLALGESLSAWCGSETDFETIHLNLITPLQIKSGNQNCTTLSLEAVVSSAMRRLENLAGDRQDPAWGAFADEVWREARSARIEKNETEWFRSGVLHRSKASWKHLGHEPGITPQVFYQGHIGRLVIGQVGPHLGWVLQAMSVVHIGRKTGVGMGWVSAEPAT